MKLKIFKCAESGRSMVDMLGVLAIIGVLTIGGVYGYTYGMNRYRANEILDGATKRAYAVASMLNSGRSISDVSLSEFSEFDDVPGGKFDSRVEDFVEQFGLIIRGVEKEVCENLIHMRGEHTTLRAVTKYGLEPEQYNVDLRPGDCDEEKNDLFLMYNLDMLGAIADKVAGSGGSSTGSSSNTSSGTGGSDVVNLNRKECVGSGYYYSGGFSAPDGESCFKTRSAMEAYANAADGTCSCMGDSDFPPDIDEDTLNSEFELGPGETYSSYDCWCYQ